MVFYAAFNIISPILGYGSEVSYQRILPRKAKSNQCGLDPGPPGYKDYSPPLSLAGPQQQN